MRKKRPERTGVVLSTKMEKTVVVKVDTTIRHPKYDKVITRSKKYYAHDETGAQEGDRVTITQTRPISKLKCWRVSQNLAATGVAT